MARCGNCGTKMSCSCKKRTASDGKVGCIQCIPNHEKKLKQQKKQAGNTPDSTPTNTAPSEIISVSVVQN